MKLLAITVDTECDKGPGWRVRYPLSFRGVHEGIGEVLQPLLERYGFRATYLLSPEVMEDERSVSLLKDVRRVGAELGTHLHGEFVEPGRKVRPEITEEKATDYDPHTEWAKLRNLTRIFTDTFGYPPLSYRAGRFAASLRTLLYLERLGYLVDSSFTPFSSVSGIDHGRAPFYPYRPSRYDPYVPGDLKVWEVPITVYPKSRYLYRFVSRFPLRRVRRWLKRRFGTVWLRPTVSDIGDVVWLTRRMESIMGGRVILVMMFHNVELVPGASPYDSHLVRGNLTDALSFLSDRGYRPVTLSGIPEVWDTSRLESTENEHGRGEQEKGVG